MTAKKIQDFSKGDLVEWEPGRFYYGTQNPGRENSKKTHLGIVTMVRKQTTGWKLCVQWHTDHFIRVYNEYDKVELERITIAARANK